MKTFEISVLRKAVGNEIVETALSNAAKISDKSFESQFEDYIFEDIAKGEAFIETLKRDTEEDLKKYYALIDRYSIIKEDLLNAKVPEDVLVAYFWKFDKHLKELLVK